MPSVRNLKDLYRCINPSGHVLDVGCFGFAQVKLASSLGLTQLRHSGVDLNDYHDLPPGFQYRKADLNKEPLPFDDDAFDLVIASHILEHLEHPVDFFSECVRVCKPGGYIYIETPSERSALLPGMPFLFDKFFSTSFYDDPTHVGRPWSAQSLHRLTRYYQCIPVDTGIHVFRPAQRFLGIFRIISALIRKDGNKLERNVWGVVGWSSYLIAQKPVESKGRQPFVYYIPSDR